MSNDLPTDVLREVFSYCDRPVNITEASPDFASVAHSIPSLWSSIRITARQLVPEGPAFLSDRLHRTGDEPLEVSIGPVNLSADAAILVDICKVLSEFNARVRRFEVTAESALLAGTIFSHVFPRSAGPYSRLSSLSVQVEDDEADGEDDDDEENDEENDEDDNGQSSQNSESLMLDKYLRHAADIFPSVKTFSLPAFYDCLPMVPKAASFSQLQTLVLDGSLEHDAPEIVLVVALLHSTPQLETLWFKHYTNDHWSGVTDDPSEPSKMVKGRDDIHSPVFLPRLTQLAVSAPGCALDVVDCLNAPALRDFHLDASRGPMRGSEERYPIDWSGHETTEVRNCLERLALRSKQLRRLAFTSGHVPHEDWKWLLFGRNSESPPFPLLESIALHGIEETPESERCGFNDALLVRYAQDPRIPLRRLALQRCSFPLKGSVLVQAFQSVLKGASHEHESYELEFGPSCPQVTEDELKTLAGIGVKLIQRGEGEVREDEWWTRGHRIDPFDSYAY